MKLQNRVALVTGGGSGIGRAVAKLFAKEGGKVIVVDMSAKSGQETLKMIRNGGGEGLFLECNTTKHADVEVMVSKAIEIFIGAAAKICVVWPR